MERPEEVDYRTAVHWLEAKIRVYELIVFRSKEIYGDPQKDIDYYEDQIAKLKQAVEVLKNINSLLFLTEREARAQTWEDAASLIQEDEVKTRTPKDYTIAFRLLAAMQRGDVYE